MTAPTGLSVNHLNNMTLILSPFQIAALQAEASIRGISANELVMQQIEAFEKNYMATLRGLMTSVADSIIAASAGDAQKLQIAIAAGQDAALKAIS
jgi:propanediol dehydratase large subunit